MPDPVAFADDHADRPYDADAVNRFFRASVVGRPRSEALSYRISRQGQSGASVLGQLRPGCDALLGPSRPLASGRHPGLPDPITCEAYSHEVSSAGFWPGGGPIDFPAFYSYAYPGPTGFSDAVVTPEAAYFDKTLGEFLLPYDDVRRAADPEAALMGFLQSTYDAAASLGDWDRLSLECAVGVPGVPRSL